MRQSRLSQEQACSIQGEQEPGLATAQVFRHAWHHVRRGKSGKNSERGLGCWSRDQWTRSGVSQRMCCGQLCCGARGDRHAAPRRL